MYSCLKGSTEHEAYRVIHRENDQPIIKSVGPDKLTTAPLYSSDVKFGCSADGNPPPKYQWLQRVSNSNSVPQDKILRSSDPKLQFINITYDFQGDYVCVVTNTIAGIERFVQSQPITLQVIGAPQVMRYSEKHEVVAHRGENAVLSVVVCADPRPRRTAWEWGSLQLEAGAGIGRYQAEELLQLDNVEVEARLKFLKLEFQMDSCAGEYFETVKSDTKEDCYEARFHVKRVDHADARNYYLKVENERGSDSHSIYLAVREPLGMSAVFTVAVGSLVVFMICILLAVYIIKSQRCCFRRQKLKKREEKKEEERSSKHVIMTLYGNEFSFVYSKTGFVVSSKKKMQATSEKALYETPYVFSLGEGKRCDLTRNIEMSHLSTKKRASDSAYM
ncbi:hypothetical protein PGB90_003275 [Kerria lacca]